MNEAEAFLVMVACLITIQVDLLVIKGWYMKDILTYKSREDRNPNPMYWGEIKSKEQLAWRILAWVIPLSWIVLIIKFITKLPPKE